MGGLIAVVRVSDAVALLFRDFLREKKRFIRDSDGVNILYSLEITCLHLFTGKMYPEINKLSLKRDL